MLCYAMLCYAMLCDDPCFAIYRSLMHKGGIMSIRVHLSSHTKRNEEAEEMMTP